MKLTIDRTKWLRGEGNVNSFLLRDRDQKRCCLGIALGAAGVKDDDLLSVRQPSQLERKLPENFQWLMDKIYPAQHSVDCGELMEANDDQGESDLQREQTIARIFAKNGVEVEFIN